MIRRLVTLGLGVYLCAAGWWLVDRTRQLGSGLTFVIAVAMQAPEPPRDLDGGITFIEYDG